MVVFIFSYKYTLHPNEIISWLLFKYNTKFMQPDSRSPNENIIPVDPTKAETDNINYYNE